MSSLREGNPLFESGLSVINFIRQLDADTLKDYALNGHKYYWQWFQSVWRESPQHVLIETGLLLFIVWLMFIRRTVDPNKVSKNARLSKREEEELIETWIPEPFVKPQPEATNDVANRLLVIEDVHGNNVSVRGYDKPILNLSSFDFLGIGQLGSIKDAAMAALEKYGCGSCGPRGFYGTIDVHMQLENEIAKFFGTQEAIAYSDGASAIISAIPAFSKKGDLLIIDEACSEPILTGASLSRSTVQYFKHNDMQDLERLLSNVDKEDRKLRRDPTEQRRFIVVEGLYKNTGNICPLPEIMKLKEKYFYRVILDESLSVGTLGATGKGVTEHFNIPVTAIEILTFTLDTTFASVGGVCIGTREVVDHQRLSGAGYCFSASTPPFLVNSAITALNELKNNTSWIKALQNNCKEFFDGLSDVKGWKIVGNSPTPVIHLALESAPQDRNREIAIVSQATEECLKRGVGVVSCNFAVVNPQAKYSKMPASLRICVSSVLSNAEIKRAIAEIKKAAAVALGGR